MSVAPPGTSILLTEITDIFVSVQVAVTSAALYDHALSFGREVEHIWMKPPSLVTALYLIERYLGDAILIVGICLCFAESVSDQLYEFRAWGALVHSWATQVIMQLRIYALYRRSKRIIFALVAMFLAEMAAIAFILWREIGPSGHIQASDAVVLGKRYCAFWGVSGNFVYFFIPFLVFELFLFLLAGRMFWENMIRERAGKKFRVNSFVSILTRDSMCYFFLNLLACAVVMGLWQGVTAFYANLCIPFVMFLEVLVGTRLILDFRERYARTDWDSTLSGRSNSPLLFREDDVRLEPTTTTISVQCQAETIVVTDGSDVSHVHNV